MVGPGTGIAPFRAYLQERRAVGAKGKNWLFFGSQHEHCNYFYKEELAELKRDGVFTRLDCAWSRDQADKAYVQHKMLNCAEEIWKWMDGEGAHFFVCGDARRMAKDVDAALRKIIQEKGGKSEEQTNEYVEKLKATNATSATFIRMHRHRMTNNEGSSRTQAFAFSNRHVLVRDGKKNSASTGSTIAHRFGAKGSGNEKSENFCGNHRSPLQNQYARLSPLPTKPTAPASPYTRNNPFPGKLVVNRRLSGPESEKDTRHFEIDLRGWGLSFEAGRLGGGLSDQRSELVNEIIHAIGAKGDEPVTAAKTKRRFAKRFCAIIRSRKPRRNF